MALLSTTVPCSESGALFHYFPSIVLCHSLIGNVSTQSNKKIGRPFKGAIHHLTPPFFPTYLDASAPLTLATYHPLLFALQDCAHSVQNPFGNSMSYNDESEQKQGGSVEGGENENFLLNCSPR